MAERKQSPPMTGLKPPMAKFATDHRLKTKLAVDHLW